MVTFGVLVSVSSVLAKRLSGECLVFRVSQSTSAIRSRIAIWSRRTAVSGKFYETVTYQMFRLFSTCLLYRCRQFREQPKGVMRDLTRNTSRVKLVYDGCGGISGTTQSKLSGQGNPRDHRHNVGRKRVGQLCHLRRVQPRFS